MSESRVANYFRCQLHDVELPMSQYLPHIREQHDSQLISITPVWREA